MLSENATYAGRTHILNQIRMKFIKNIVSIFFLSSAMLLFSCGSGDSGSENLQTFYVNTQSETMPEMAIKEIMLTDMHTLINFRFTNSRETTANVGIAAPGHESAYFIVDKKANKSYKLQEIEGIPVLPGTVSVKSNESIDFTLKFEKLPENVSEVDIIQGKKRYKSFGKGEWEHAHFRNIKLKPLNTKSQAKDSTSAN